MAANAENLAIQTHGLTKYFRNFWGQKKVVAVESLDLDVRLHEVYGLLGPNGSGKSTTIKMLLGLLFTSKGWAKVLSQPPGDVRTNARIGYLPEESYLYPFLNARETLDFYGRLFGLPAKQRADRTESLLDMVGLSAVARRPVGEYSKGMARRIGLAQALINDPDLLILDEPTSGLDPIGTRQIKDLICQLGRRGKTVLLCSHLLADVEDVCDRIGILYGGVMQTEGSVDELLEQNDLTQISSPRLSDSAVERIFNIIRSEHSESEPLEISTPRRRLEEYFLEVVASAHAAEQSTSGAVISSTGVSDFLSGGDLDDAGQADRPEALLDNLVRPDEAKLPDGGDLPGAGPSGTDLISVEPVDETSEDVLDALVEKSDPAGLETVPGNSQEDLTERLEPTDMAQSQDSSLIDRLVKSSEKDKSSDSDGGNDGPGRSDDRDDMAGK